MEASFGDAVGLGQSVASVSVTTQGDPIVTGGFDSTMMFDQTTLAQPLRVFTTSMSQDWWRAPAPPYGQSNSLALRRAQPEA